MRDLVLGLACLVVGFGSAPAGADCLDRAFADNGWSLEPPGAAAALVRQADGKLLVAGQVGDFYHSRFLLARYDVNGALDPTFGTGGTVETSFGGGGDKSSAFAVALQADGKIVAVGSTEPYTGSPPVLFGPAEVALARYETNGVLDATFGTAGQVTSPFPAATTAHGVVVQPGGRIVVAGASATGAFGADQFFFARYDADGTLDPTFGSGGSVVLGSGSANALVRQADGKLAAAGFVHSGGIDHFALARVDGDGVPDAMFGSGGTVVTDATPSGGQSDGEALVVQDGKLVAAGYAYGRGFTLVRYNEDGTPDATFGSGGIASTGQGAVAFALALDSDGKLVAAGSAYDGLDYNVVIARFTSDGVLDPTLGGGGVVATEFDTESDDIAKAVLPQPDGTIVVAGSAGAVNNGSSSVLLARFDGAGCTAPCVPPECPVAPACTTRPEKNRLLLARTSTSERLVWKWSRPASAVDVADFGDPVSGLTSFDLQLLDNGYGGREVAHWPYFSSGGSWTRIARGFKFQWSELGLSATLRAGPARKARLRFRFKRPPSLLLPPMPLTPPVAIRLVRDDGRACWTSTFPAESILTNSFSTFDAR